MEEDRSVGVTVRNVSNKVSEVRNDLSRIILKTKLGLRQANPRKIFEEIFGTE